MMSSGTPRWTEPLILVLFFASGASGLVYEVVWTRVLLTVFGATLYAVATVLAAFMGGLALGSLLGGRLADRTRRPLLSYGVVEILAAATALAVPWMLERFTGLYQMVYANGEASFLQLSLIRFAVSFLVLLIPTSCLGATLPLLSRFLARSDHQLGAKIGRLYAVNTTGAVVGTFAAGFVLIATAGVWMTMVAAAAMSTTVGVVSVLVSRRLEQAGRAEPAPASQQPAAQESAPPSPPEWCVWLVLVTYALSGFVALSCQVLWTRTLVFQFSILKNTTYSFSAMLCVFLIGLALGSAAMSSRVSRLQDPVRAYAIVQLCSGLAIALSLPVLVSVAGYVQLADPLGGAGGFSWLLAVSNVFVRTGVTMFVPTLLMGMAFPLAARVTVRHTSVVGAGVGRLYAFNTIGAICGAFAAGFLLVPLLGLARGIIVLGLTNVCLGIAVLMVNPAQHWGRRLGEAGLAAAAMWCVAALGSGPAPFQKLAPGETIVREDDGGLAYREGPLATVAVLENTIGHRIIYIDNVSVAGTDRILLTDQKSLAHVPTLFLPEPRSALTVGFGSGGASWSLLQYKELERVDCIEICPTVPRLAQTLRASNHGVLDEWDRQSSLVGQRFFDGRYRVIIDDARSYLRFSKQRYDIIATDCTDLRYKSNANLYDVEYFSLCRSAITEQGLVVVWMPLGGMSDEVFACAMLTFAHVFPDMTVWYMHNEPTHYLLLLGSKVPLQINLSRLLDRIGRPEIRQDLAEVSLQQPEKILSCFLTEAPSIRSDLEALTTVLNTPDTPLLEFESPKYGIGDEPLLSNLEILRRRRSSVLAYIEDAEEHPALIERLQRFVTASDVVMEGHKQLRRLQLQDAARTYLRAQRLCPQDESIAFLLRFDDLQRRVARYHNDLWSAVTLAEIDAIKGELGEAMAGFSRVIEVTAQRNDELSRAMGTRALLGLARSLEQAGQPKDALRLLLLNAARLEGNSEFSLLVDKLRGETGRGAS